MAEGLGQGFHPYFRSILGAMLVKLKDKKCAGVLGTCLDRVYGNPHSLDQVRFTLPVFVFANNSGDHDSKSKINLCSWVFA